MLNLKSTLLASICLLPLLAGEALAATAGVTAAVNQNAKSIPPGGAVRTIVLGGNVVQDEKIETDAGGLVQILLADGTTFTVGPNSSLVIDRFVYDPDANTAEVAASLGRGVFRFIGGRTSKTEGGVTLNTPVGTVGIRGGMVDLNFTQGANGQVAQIDLLFGNEVTLGTDKVFTPGYSIIIGGDGQPAVVKTPPGSASIIQQALAGRPGASGGSSQQPSDDDVENSQVGETNSGTTPPNPQDIPPPELNAIDLATPPPNDNHQVAEDVVPQGPKTLDGTYRGYAAASVKRSTNGGSAVQSFYTSILPEPIYGEGPEDVEYPLGTHLEFDPATGKFSGAIEVRDGSPENTGTTSESTGTLYVEFGSDVTGGTSAYVNDLYYYGTGPNSSANFSGTQGSGGTGTYVFSIGIGSAVDCDCDFAQIGYWLNNSTFTGGQDGPEAIDALGTFVVGDLLTAAAYDDAGFYGTATYEGVSTAVVRNGTNEYLAVGTMAMTYYLGARNGDIDVNIDGRGFAADITGFDANGFAEFGGSSTTGQKTFSTNGAFVNNGDDLAAGVIGNFTAADGANWSAGGVYAGAQTGPIDPSEPNY